MVLHIQKLSQLIANYKEYHLQKKENSGHTEFLNTYGIFPQ